MHLLPCPLCGCDEFDIFDDSDSQVAAIYCMKCPYGVEEAGSTVEKLASYHNKRYNREKNEQTI